METSRYISCLQHDAARLREVARGSLDLAVPSCPDWTVTDLVVHVAKVYQDKIQVMRTGKFQSSPPPATGEQPIEEFDRSLSELLDEFDRREPTDQTRTWYGPDQSVGFWIRRMAQETVIHRVDAELAIDDVTAIPTDLALDGIDEVLGIFLGWRSIEMIRRTGPESWPELEQADDRVIVVRGHDLGWSVRATSSGVRVSSGVEPDAAATVSGDPVDVLLWLWRRAGDEKLAVRGDAGLVSGLRGLMYRATQ